MAVVIGPSPLDGPVARELIAALNAELLARYPEEGATHFALALEEVAPGRGAFLVAWRDEVAIGCGARIAIPFAARTGKVKLMVLLSPDLTGVTDQELAAVSKLPLEIYGNGDEEGAKRLFAMNTNEQTQTKLYRRKEKGMDLYRADRTVREGIDVYFQLVYGAWSADDF